MFYRVQVFYITYIHIYTYSRISKIGRITKLLFVSRLHPLYTGLKFCIFLVNLSTGVICCCAVGFIYYWAVIHYSIVPEKLN